MENLSLGQGLNVAKPHETRTKTDSAAFRRHTFVLQQNAVHVPLVRVPFHVALFPAAPFRAVHVHVALFRVAP